MCFLKNQEAFEKYLEFLVGRVQAESVVVSTAVQEFYKVPLPQPVLRPLPPPHSVSKVIFPDPAGVLPPATAPQPAQALGP